MVNCLNCNAPLKEGSKFCTNCGAPLEGQDRRVEVNKTPHQAEVNKTKPWSKLTKIIFGLLAVISLFFIIRSIVTNLDITRNSMSISKELSKIEGEWYDPTGTLLKNENAIISFRKKGGKIVGEDINKTLYIGLLAYRVNEYSGLVAIGDDSENYSVQYDPHKGKLFFVGDRTKKEWYLQKDNNK